MALLEVTAVEAAYGAIRALRGVSFAVEEGSATTLLGPNGAGKTTVLRCITGLHRASRGTIMLGGRDITRLRPDEIVRAGVAMVPERREVFGGLSVGENLRLGAFSRRDKATVSTDLERILDQFPILRQRWSDRAGALSGGQQQILSIGRALMSNPRVLLLDEPSLGLAPIIIQEVFRTIKQTLRDGRTVLIVEQNARMALSVAERGYVLDHGEVVLADTADALRADDRVQRSYLGQV